ncbi:hypothetical protein KCU62_g1409, partial [Aureobasidium sp. EXF-3399]
MEQVTELMQLVCDNSVEWRELDLHALEAKIDTFEQYLDPELCLENSAQDQESETPTNTASPTSGSSDEMYGTTEGRISATDTQLHIDQQYKDEHNPALTDHLDGTKEYTPLDLSTTSTGSNVGSQIRHNGQKRSHDIAFSTNAQRMSPATTEPSDPERRVQDPDRLWEQIETDVGILAEVYQKFAMITVKSVNDPVGPRRLKVLDMASLKKPTSYPGCVERFMTAISATALHNCFDGALDAIDYEIADNVCKASRVLMDHCRQIQIADTRGDGPSPNGAQKRACKNFMEDARRYLQMWQFEQFIQRAAADGVVTITVDVVMQYMQAAQSSRATDKLQNFLVQVNRMTRALGSAMDELEELQR